MFHGSNNQASHASRHGFAAASVMYGAAAVAAIALRQEEATYG